VRYSLLFLALCAPSLACEPAAFTTPSSRGKLPSARPSASVEAPAAFPSAQGKLPAVQGVRRERCPDELLPRGAEADLAVRVEDVRAERRNLLPVDLGAALRAESSGRSTSRRYLAELLVDGYSAPRLFRRLNAPRSEWAAGSMQARLVVHDLATHHVLCQVPLSVRGNATGAPISRRLRESTRQALENKLYARARAEMDTALGSISSVLRLARGTQIEGSAQGS
jgi:hypothetical protein